MLQTILILVFCIIIIVILKIGLNIKIKNIKKIKEIGYDKTLNEIADKFPGNQEICKTILKKLGNDSVKIEENNDSKASLYIAATNKIIIAGIKDTFTRIQTIAHECLHSIQNRKILLFNFSFSNIYLSVFLALIVLILLNIGEEYTNLYIFGYVLLSLVYIGIRLYLENEAMSKAPYLAKEYMNEYKQNIENEEEKVEINDEEIDKLVKGFEDINKIGIPLTNFYLISLCLIKVIILCIIALI